MNGDEIKVIGDRIYYDGAHVATIHTDKASTSQLAGFVRKLDGRANPPTTVENLK